MSTEEQRKEAEAGAELEVVYKTKVVQFLGRSTPIILQNNNGPCPLIAICNVLLLRHNLNLSSDASEVSLQKLLSLVAERLIDSNSNVQDKDDGYVRNQQQNIADAIDLLPCLATGIDVNVHFRKINDFEFTRECTIFDLLDIGLYHGWIVDPQDTDTAEAIGSKSYNMLVAELVAFETRKSEGENKDVQEEDSVDFAAAATATLGVPSPSLSRGRSIDDYPVSATVDQTRGSDDIEEEEELMRALNLSRAEMSNPVKDSMSPVFDWSNPSPNLEESTHSKCFGSGTLADSLGVQNGVESQQSYQLDLFAGQESITSSDWKDGATSEDSSSVPRISSGNNSGQTVSEGSVELLMSSDSVENVRTHMLIQNVSLPLRSTDKDGSNGCCTNEDLRIASGGDKSVRQTCTEDISTSQIHDKPTDDLIDCNSAVFSGPVVHCSYLPSASEREKPSDVSVVVSSSLEREEHILESGHTAFQNREPVYEGEVVLAEQDDKTEEDNSPTNLKDVVARHQWQLIKNFLENNASQLTIYGLFCLQEGIKERELGVFFRNNHFCTMLSSMVNSISWLLIKHYLTVRMTPQQNGVAERMNRTLTEKARSLRLQTSLPKTFWGDAITFFCFLVNRSPNRKLDGGIPEEIWSRKKVELGHLKVFGCPAYALVEAIERSKLDPKSQKMVFIGYPQRVKGYLLWDPHSQKSTISRNVIFDEESILKRPGVADEAQKAGQDSSGRHSLAVLTCNWQLRFNNRSLNNSPNASFPNSHLLVVERGLSQVLMLH
ncbi:uncharacterized protein LOC103698954 isoform X4 [Phoenix dactylifera]|uniref:Uncharacterized protein LOC103698954 isoform X4 n=1 Tax=Phoenix dactylifera TaxID=42345 RepID=A0A8B8ZWQ8_PHODC|nr:uncharacterized protein LOC103698954 isoform X4 [Phoenix dactylifera]